MATLVAVPTAIAELNDEAKFKRHYKEVKNKEDAINKFKGTKYEGKSLSLYNVTVNMELVDTAIPELKINGLRAFL